MKEVGASFSAGAEMTATTPGRGQGLRKPQQAARSRAAVSETRQTSACERRWKWRDGRQCRKHRGTGVWARSHWCSVSESSLFLLLLSCREAELGMLSHEVLLWFPNQVTERALAWLEGKRLTAPYECLCLVGGGSEEFRYFRVPPTASSLVCCLGTLPFSPCVRALSRSLWYIWEDNRDIVIDFSVLAVTSFHISYLNVHWSDVKLRSSVPRGLTSKLFLLCGWRNTLERRLLFHELLRIVATKHCTNTESLKQF